MLTRSVCRVLTDGISFQPQSASSTVSHTYLINGRKPEPLPAAGKLSEPEKGADNGNEEEVYDYINPDDVQ